MPKQSNKLGRYFRQNYSLYLMLIPALAFLLIYKFLPLYGLTIAFKDFNIFLSDNALLSIAESPWAGFDHFKRLFGNSDFLQVLQNTLVISLMKIIFLFPAPILIAILLNEIRNKYFKKTMQTILYMPHFLSWVVIFGLFYTLLSSDGVLNHLLTALGLQDVQFFTDPKLFRWLVILTDGWKEIGWSSIVYLAALTSIDLEQYEAAVIDGANRIKQIWFITLPNLLPIIVLMLIMRVSAILNAGFEQILIMYNPSVYKTADIIQTYVYRIGLGQMDFSLGTALGMFESVIAFVLVVSCNAISKRMLGKSIW